MADSGDLELQTGEDGSKSFEPLAVRACLLFGAVRT